MGQSTAHLDDSFRRRFPPCVVRGLLMPSNLRHAGTGGGRIAPYLALLLAVVSGVLRAAAGDVATGSLLVESEPPGASVYVDGRSVGETPLTLPTVAAGEHRVRVVRLGYLENSRLITVKP